MFYRIEDLYILQHLFLNFFKFNNVLLFQSLKAAGYIQFFYFTLKYMFINYYFIYIIILIKVLTQIYLSL